MKVLYTCALLAIVCLTSWAKADFMKDLQTFNEVCQQESQVTNAELWKFFLNGMNPADGSNAVKCHLKCLMKKEGTLKNGEFNGEGFEKEIQKIIDDTKKLIAMCKGVKGANECDTAFKITMCFKDNAEAIGFSP